MAKKDGKVSKTKGIVEGRIAVRNQKKPLAYPIPKTDAEKKAAPTSKDSNHAQG